MKEKLLLSVGVVFVLFGVIGVCAVGFAYYYTKPYLDELQPAIEFTSAVVNLTTNDVSAAIANATACMIQLERDFEDISIAGWQPDKLRDVEARLREFAPAVWKVGWDVKAIGQTVVTTLQEDILPLASLIRFAIEMSFVLIAVLHALFIMMGASILWMRKSLQSVINRNKT